MTSPNSNHLARLALPLLGMVAFALAMLRPALAQESGAPALADSSSAGEPSALPAPGLDSLGVSALGDSAWVPADSSAAVADSSAAVADASEAAADSSELAPPLEELLPAWTTRPDLGPADLKRIAPQGLEFLLEALPETSVRIAGDRGAPARASLQPLGPGAMEILYEGVPTRSPADLDPGLWDRSVIGLRAVLVEPTGAAGPMGGGVLRLEAEPAQPGRTVTRSHFYKASDETYLRGLSLTTPRSARELRLDFEEWKSEEGFGFSNNAALGAIASYGRSKMRRFRLGGSAHTELGRLSMNYARGRRYYRGTIVSNNPVERWTGEISTGLDGRTAQGSWRLRLYHLDWHDDDRAQGETRDASRLGGRVELLPESSGLVAHLDFERWSARFDGLGGQTATPPPAYAGRLGMGWRLHRAERLDAEAGAELAFADHTTTHFVPAAHADLRWAPGGGSADLHLSAARSLRAPTLLETAGFSTLDLPLGGQSDSARRTGAGPVAFEQHDRIGAMLGLGERARAEIGIERWRLRDGIGWRATGENEGTTLLLTAVDEVALDLDQLTGRLRLVRGRERHGVHAELMGQYVLGSLESSATRGAGWPEWSARVWLRWWHQLFGPADFIHLSYVLRAAGERLDDGITDLVADAAVAPAVTRHDLRFSLRLREAELYLEFRNLTDAVQEEMLGTTTRGRDMIWGLVWPFYN